MNRPRPSAQTAPSLNLSAYPALDFTGMSRRANYRLISYAEDMLHVLDKKEAAAIVYHILFRWSERRREDIIADIEHRLTHNLSPFTPLEVEKRLWIYMSYNQFVRESGGALGYNTVIRMLEYLLNKKVIARRKNPNPRYSEYEYRINTEEVQALLKTLPAFPRYTPKGAKGTGNSANEPTHMGTDTPQTGTGQSERSTASLSTPPTQHGLPTTHMGTADYPDGGTSQNPPQVSSQQQQQQQQQQHALLSNNSNETLVAAAAIAVDMGTLTSDEIALIQAYRHQRQQNGPAETHAAERAKANAAAVTNRDVLSALAPDERVGSPPSPDAPEAPSTQGKPEETPMDKVIGAPVQSGEREQRPTAHIGHTAGAASGVAAANASTDASPPESLIATADVGVNVNPFAPPEQPTAAPAPEPALTPEAVVALFERKRAVPYDAVTRPRQLAAARMLLALALPLDALKLERVYDQYHDPWWQAHYGDLHVSHLVEREKSGEIRIVRWLARMATPSRTRTTRASLTPTPEQRAGIRPMIGVSGFPIFQPSKTPLTVLAPPPPARRPGMSMTFAGKGR